MMRSNGATTSVVQLASRPGQAGQMPTATPNNGKDKEARGRSKTAILRHQGDVCVGSRRNGRRTGCLPYWLGRRRTPLQLWNDGEQRQKRVKPTVGGAERCSSRGTGSQDVRCIRDVKTDQQSIRSQYAGMRTR